MPPAFSSLRDVGAQLVSINLQLARHSCFMSQDATRLVFEAARCLSNLDRGIGDISNFHGDTSCSCVRNPYCLLEVDGPTV